MAGLLAELYNKFSCQKFIYLCQCSLGIIFIYYFIDVLIFFYDFFSHLGVEFLDPVNEDNACMIPETSSLEMLNSASVQANELSSFPLLPDGGQMNFEVSSVNIPTDQMRMIQNINALISEVASIPQFCIH